MKHKKENRYSNLKLILRIITLAIATTALILAIQNKSHIDWIQNTQINMIEKVLFP